MVLETFGDFDTSLFPNLYKIERQEIIDFLNRDDINLSMLADALFISENELNEIKADINKLFSYPFKTVIRLRDQINNYDYFARAELVTRLQKIIEEVQKDTDITIKCCVEELKVDKLEISSHFELCYAEIEKVKEYVLNYGNDLTGQEYRFCQTMLNGIFAQNRLIGKLICPQAFIYQFD